MVIVWRITDRCNLACKFCGFDRELSRARRDADVETVRRFGAVLAELQHLTGDSVLVSWLGGEPLLWSPLADLTRLFCEDYHLRVSTTTNGWPLASAAVRAHVLQYYSELTISVDGIGEIHDQLRGWPGGCEALRRDVTALAREKQSAQRGPVLRANVVLMRQTVGQFEVLCAELATWGIEEIVFNQLGGNDRPEFYPDHRLLPEQADWIAAEAPRLRSRPSARGVRLLGGDPYLRRFCATANNRRIRVQDCKPGRKFLFIDETGIIAPCSFTTSGYGVPVNEASTVEALSELPLRLSRRQQELPLRPCEDCHSTQLFEKFQT